MAVLMAEMMVALMASRKASKMAACLGAQKVVKTVEYLAESMAVCLVGL